MGFKGVKILKACFRDDIVNLRKLTRNNSNLNLVNVIILVLKILSGNEILILIKVHNSVVNLRNLIRFHRFVQKISSGNEMLSISKGLNSVVYFAKNDAEQFQRRSCQRQCICQIWCNSINSFSRY